MAAIKGAVAFPFNLPPILGLGSTGGFQYALEALQGQPPSDVAAALRGLIVAANGQPELAGVFSTYAADTPQIYLDIDRDKAQVLGVKITDIFNALQSTLGRFYVNDFNVFGRTWQVNIQAETPFRDNIDDIYRIYVRNAQGGMVPIRAVAEAKLVQGPQTVVRYNGYRGAIVNGAPKPGYSSGQALAAMERISATTLPAGYSYRMDRHGAAGKGGERTHRHRARVRRPVRLSVSGRTLRELEYSGVRPLVGQRRGARRHRRAGSGGTELRCLRADRARGADRARREERHSDRCVRGGAGAGSGKDIDASAIEAASLRFRPVMMTSFAFIFGLLPLVIAGGAGALTRHAVGTPVFGGMIAASVFGIFLIPLLYITAERLRRQAPRQTPK